MNAVSKSDLATPPSPPQEEALKRASKSDLVGTNTLQAKEAGGEKSNKKICVTKRHQSKNSTMREIFHTVKKALVRFPWFNSFVALGACFLVTTLGGHILLGLALSITILLLLLAFDNNLFCLILI